MASRNQPLIGVTGKKPVARAAIVGVSDELESLLRDCFRQFNITTVKLDDDPAQRFNREKFEACIVRLDDGAEAVLAAARNSPSNKRLVVYGVGSSAQQAMRFSKYGVNAVFHEPLERQSALKVVRATHLLVINELRRYVRVPLVAEVILNVSGNPLRGYTQEVSAGGLSLECKSKLGVGQPVEVRFTLPERPQITSQAVVCWAKPNESTFGVRFDVGDDRRLAVRKWIDDYLEV